MSDQFLWVEQYRPKKIDECILPESIKKMMKAFLKDQAMINLILSGSPGTGKTTVARAMMEELDADYIMINASKDRNIDTLRTTVADFASKVSFTGRRKYVILDEADYLNMQSTQPALRNFIEEYSSNCGFILTCNHINRIHEALQSRCPVVEFKEAKGEERKVILKEAYSRFKFILDKEKVPFDPQVLIAHIRNFYPDLRRALNELQKFSKLGNIDTSILSAFSNKNIEDLVEYLKNKKFMEMRKWVAENPDVSFDFLVQKLSDLADNIMEKSSLPALYITLNQHQYQNAFVANKEINTVAMLTEIMRDCY